MGYYLRVLSTSEQPVPVPQLEKALMNEGLEATWHVEAGTPLDWTELALRNMMELKLPQSKGIS